MRPFNLAGEHHAEAACLAFHPEGRLLATGGLDDRVVLWDVATGRRRRVFRGFGGMALSLSFLPGGRELAVGGKGPIHLLDVEQGEEKGRLMAPEGFLYGLASDGGRLMAGGQDGKVRCWGHNSDGLLWERTLGIGTVHGLCTLPDGRAVVIGESSRLVVLDRLGNPMAEMEAHRDTVSSLAVNAAGTWFATGADDGTVSIWNATSLRRIATEFLDDPAVGMSFSPRHPLLAVTCREGALRLYDWRGGHMVRSEMDESERLSAVMWSPDGAMLAGTRTDGGVRIWGRRPDAPKVVDRGEAVPDEEIETVSAPVAAPAAMPAEEPKADLFANPAVKWGAIAVGAILVTWMVSGMIRNVNKGWRQYYDQARVALRQGDWEAAAQPLGVLEGCCSGEPAVAGLLTTYAEEAWAEERAEAESAVARQDWQGALGALAAVPEGPRPTPPPWFGRIRSEAAGGRLADLEGLVRARIDEGRWGEARSLLNEADGLAGILGSNPAWIAKGNSDTIVGEARIAMARGRTSRDGATLRAAAHDVLQILPEDTDAAGALWEAAALDGAPVAAVEVGTDSGVFSIAWDGTSERLLYGATGTVGGWRLGAAPATLAETGSGKPVYGLAPGAGGGVVVMDRDGIGTPGGWSLSPNQVFSVFAATPDGGAMVGGEPEEKGLVVAVQGQPGRDLPLPSNPTAAAMADDRSIAVGLGRVVFGFSFERLEQMARVELGGTRNDVIHSVAILPGSPRRYVAGDNTGAVWLAADEARLDFPLPDSPADPVSAVVAAGDGRWFAVAAEEKVLVWDSTGRLRMERDHPERVTALAVVGGGAGLAVAHGDTLLVVDLRELPEVSP